MCGDVERWRCGDAEMQGKDKMGKEFKLIPVLYVKPVNFLNPDIFIFIFHRTHVQAYPNNLHAWAITNVTTNPMIKGRRAAIVVHLVLLVSL